MYQYVGIAWNPEDVRQAESAKLLTSRLQTLAGWKAILRIDGLIVAHQGARPASSDAFGLASGEGVLVGNVFTKARNAQLRPGPFAFGSEESAAILSSAGRHLVSNYWGRYVAFLRDANSRTSFVIVDPCGELPCMFTQLNGVSIIFSRPQVCAALGINGFSVNWDYIAAHSIIGALQTRECGLLEISEVIGGERLAISKGQVQRELLWNPLAISEQEVLEDAGEATELIKETTRACVNAWASCYPRILHNLSGGLDSSIVLACLAEARSSADLTCINYVTEDPLGDERDFSRAMAEHAGCSVVEHVLDPTSANLKRMLSVVPSVRPWSYRYSLEHADVEARTSRAFNATAVFSGGGGDQTFYNSHVDFAIQDFVRRHPFRRQVGRVARDVARVEGQSIWKVLVEGLYKGLTRTPFDLYRDVKEYRALVAAKSVDAKWKERFRAPWLEGKRNPLPGKHWQIHNLSIPNTFYDPLGHEDGPEFVKPLRSQPILELVLRIPTYTLITGGWDRALARRAFADVVPLRIISRRTKGGLGDHSAQLLRNNMIFVREMLIDGLLVREGILDKDKLDKMLSTDIPTVSPDFFALEDHLSTEIWLRKWGGLRQRAAA